MKKFHIITFGCQMNEHDSEKMAGLLSAEGVVWTDNPHVADLVLINSCTIRWKADEKAFSQAGRLKMIKRVRPHLKIGFCGCVAQREREYIFARAPYIDFVFGTLNISSLPFLLKRVQKGEKNVCQVLDEPLREENYQCLPLRPNRVKAWVTIMEGCNNFCAYCVVPYVRGRQRSRAPEEIISEAQHLAASGYKEITLLGQNVNSYGLDLQPQVEFSELLYLLDRITGIERIRFVTSHPKDLSSNLIHALKECKHVCEHIHLPLQSGSDTVLKRMGRGYTIAEYREKVTALRKAVPGIAITGDMICGFPGEREEDFEQTLRIIEEVRYDGLFSFHYSSRPQTVASRMSDQVSDEVKMERLQTLQSLQNKISFESNKQMLHLELPLLIEGPSKKNPNKLTGRTRTNKIVNVERQDNLIGKEVMVRIIGAKSFDLDGEIINT